MSMAPMKRCSTIFLQTVVVFIGLGAAGFLLREPHLEGRNAQATLFEMYFKDPFLAYAYVASIPFFAGLYQAFRVLAHVRQNATFSQATVRALRTMKYCAVAVVTAVIISVVFMLYEDGDDRPAGVFLRILVAFPATVVATAAATFERILQSAVELKAENDLTV